MALLRSHSSDSETDYFPFNGAGHSPHAKALGQGVAAVRHHSKGGLGVIRSLQARKRCLEALENEEEEDALVKRSKDKRLPSREPDGVLHGGEGSENSCDTEADLCCWEDGCRPTPGGGASSLALPEALRPEHCLALLRPGSACSVSGPLPSLSVLMEGHHSEEIDVIGVMMEKELDLCQLAGYLSNHGPDQLPDTFIDAGMRAVALSWLVEVACEFQLHQETLFYATNMVDRFLFCSKAMERTNLQLISVTCLLIAAKFEEEQHAPAIEFTKIADKTFEHHHLLSMEVLVLNTLEYRIMAPTTFAFLSALQQGLYLSQKVCHLASYILELCIIEYHLLDFRSSTLAASAILLADVIVNWNSTFRDPALAILASPRGKNHDSREDPRCLNADLFTRIQAMLKGSIGPVALAIEALNKIHQRVFYTQNPRDADVILPCLAIKEKYRDTAFMAISLDAPLEGEVLWPIGLLSRCDD